MRRIGAGTLVVVLLLGTLPSPVAVGPPGPVDHRIAGSGTVAGQVVEPVAGHPDRTQMGQMNESAPLGGLVSSVVGMEEATVDATMAISRFETRYAAATTDEERAAAVASSLNATRMRVSMLERRLATLEARRMNGSITEGWFAVELSWLLSSAENQGAVLARLERAARTLPPAALRERNASVAAIEQVRARVDRLQDREAPGIHQTSFDRTFYRDLATRVGTYNETAGSRDFGVLGDLVDDERVNLYVRPAMGAASVVSFRTTGDGRITDLRAGEHPDATVRVTMDAETARRLVSADDPDRVLRRAFLRGEITVEGIGLVNGLKWGVRGVVLAVFRFLVTLGGG